MGVDPLGLAGAAASPNYNNIGIAQAQQVQQKAAQINHPLNQAQWNAVQAANAYQNILGSAQQAREPLPFVTVQPMRVFIEARTKILVDQLPFRVLARIARVEFTTDRIVICYDNMRQLELFDVDTFPSDEHISRILLDAP